ncbi:MAG: glucose 1-dehydrogenase [Myxococcota bacterium]
MRFASKVAVVTGAGSGFGEAIAKRFANEGAEVVAADIDPDRGKRVVEQIDADGGRAIFVETDVSKGADIKRMFDACVDAFGGVDIIVNNAGFSHRIAPLWEIAEEDYDRVFATNTKSVYLAAVHGVPLLRKRGGGSIINTASIGAVRPRANVTAYNATKGAVVTLTRGLAIELGPDRIRVNAVNPLASETGFIKNVLGTDKFPDAVRESMIREVPLGRLAQPSDVASAVLFLASDDAAFITGIALGVDGGRSI